MKKSIYISALFFLSLSINSFSQNITYNNIDTSKIETRKVMKLFENYIHSKPDSLYDNPYWNNEEKEQYKVFDLLERGEFYPSLYMGFPIHVLSIKSNKGLYEIKAQFSNCENGTPYVLCIANFYAKKEGEEYKLYNALPINRLNWLNTRIGLVNYYYPSNHKFDTLKARKMEAFINEICKNLDVEPIPFTYYMADDFDEIQRLRGFDYWMGMGGEVKPTGRGGSDLVFCSGMGENYFHEPYHVLIGPHYTNGHWWISEGMATYLGGSRGQPLEWHLKRINTYLQSHPEIDLNNMLKLSTMDEYTDYRYVIGGLIVKRVFEKGGWNLLKEFMNSGTSNEDYYNAIEKYLGVRRTDLNKYLRQQIELEANK